MEMPFMLARLFGVMLLLINVGMLANSKFYQTICKDIPKQPGFLFLSGFVYLLLGLLVLHVHPMGLTMDWMGLITLLAWLMVFSGAIRLVAPQLAVRYLNTMAEKSGSGIAQAITVIFVLIGFYLSYVGFSA